MASINVTIAVPAELHQKMKEHNEISWSAVIRNTIEQKLADMELLDKLVNKSKLNEKDVEALAEKVDRKVAKKLGWV